MFNYYHFLDIMLIYVQFLKTRSYIVHILMKIGHMLHLCFKNGHVKCLYGALWYLGDTLAFYAISFKLI